MHENNQNPFVSIILPIRNEASYIERALNAILAQDYPSHCLEILIVDGMSTDATREIVTEIARKLSILPIRILDNPEKIVPTGLNIGLRQARGEIIIRVDGHTEIAPDYVRQCVRHLLKENEDA